ncbi:hypothetical protein QQS21_005660 [Conoideocrella luteorostrata]|uniref:catechol O-methyltransferase n=1 Tax=Conoideocrella luteorostrata TaxID=1105319 RepID=A0AAJ0CRS2_9HYPO|nr:hypothetical protein QQS21_005660 [Conoideocrella luteorostrata]
MAAATEFYKPEETICYGDGREQRLLAFIKSHPNYDKMRDSPSEVLSGIDDFGRQEDFLMNVGKYKGGIITKYINAHKPKLIVELGGYVGYSAIMLGAAQRAAGGEKYISLEMNPEFARVASSLITLAGLGDFIDIVTGPCDQSLRTLRQTLSNPIVDLLFLDHKKTSYVSDAILCEDLSLIGPGSTIIADNVISPGAPLYLEYIRGSYSQKDKIRDQLVAGNGEISTKGNVRYVYESELHESLEPTGEKDGLEVSVCVQHVDAI